MTKLDYYDGINIQAKSNERACNMDISVDLMSDGGVKLTMINQKRKIGGFEPDIREYKKINLPKALEYLKGMNYGCIEGK